MLEEMRLNWLNSGQLPHTNLGLAGIKEKEEREREGEREMGNLARQLSRGGLLWMCREAAAPGAAARASGAGRILFAKNHAG